MTCAGTDLLEHRCAWWLLLIAAAGGLYLGAATGRRDGDLRLFEAFARFDQEPVLDGWQQAHMIPLTDPRMQLPEAEVDGLQAGWATHPEPWTRAQTSPAAAIPPLLQSPAVPPRDTSWTGIDELERSTYSRWGWIAGDAAEQAGQSPNAAGSAWDAFARPAPDAYPARQDAARRERMLDAFGFGNAVEPGLP